MIETRHLYTTLRRSIRGPQLPILIKTILHEPLILQALQDQNLLDLLADSANTDLQAWQPGNLALLQLDVGLIAQQIRNKPTAPLSPELRQKAVEFYELYRNQQNRKINSLAEAGLIALALRERARILGSWEGLTGELPDRNPRDTRLILACAYSYLSEPETHLREYCQGSKQLSLCAQVIYLQPLAPQKQARIIAGISQTVRASDRLQLLIELQHDHPEDAHLLAHELLQFEQPAAADVRRTDVNLWAIPEQYYFAEVYRLAEISERALAGFERLGEDLHNLYVGTTYRLLTQAINNQQFEWIDGYQDDGERFVRLNGDQMADLAYRLYQAGQAERAAEYLAAAGNTPAASIVKARYQTGDLTKTERQALLAESIETWRCERSVPVDLLLECGYMLLELDRPDLAVELGRYLSECYSDVFAGHLLLSKAAHAHGDSQQAVSAAQLAAALAPEDEDAHRALIAALEANQDWPAALVEYQSLLKLSDLRQSHDMSLSASTEQKKQDFRSFAVTAAHAGEIETALEIGWKLLGNQPEDGKTDLALGRIYLIADEHELAVEHLRRANQLLPDQPDTWLSLAEAYEKDGKPPAVEQTLKTAVQALPDNAEVHLALGRYYHQHNQTTQALNVLQKAASLENLNPNDRQKLSARGYLAPRTAEIVLLLGTTLLQLGHADQAVDLLGAAYRSRDYKQAAAYRYARALLAVGEEHQALSALSIAHQTDPGNHELALEYARLLLKLGEQPDIAAGLLKDLLANGCSDLEISGLLAEALAATEDFHSALIYYQKALESNLVNDPHWSIRLALGLSHVAVATHTPNLAIAALQDAIQQAPDHLALHQKLAEACLAAGLEEDARHIAHQAYQLSPANVENILWYTEQCHRLQEDERSYQALCEAVELFPNHIELRLRLAQIEHRTDHLESAIGNYQSAAALPDISYAQLYTAANGLLQMDRPDLTVSCLERIQQELLTSESNGMGHRLLVLLANGYDRLGENKTALQLFDRALEQQADSPALLKHKALIHLRLDQYSAAAACLAQVLRTHPQDFETYQLLVRTYEAQGDLPKALEHAHHALEYASDEQFRLAVLEAARLSWCLFRQQDATQLIGSFTSAANTHELTDSTLLHRLITSLIAIDSQNWAFISELNQDSPLEKPAAAVDTAIAALDHVQHGEIEIARQLQGDLSTLCMETQPTSPIIFGLLIETSLRLFDYSQAMRFAHRWLEVEPLNPRAHLTRLRVLTEWTERDAFFGEIQASGKWTVSSTARRQHAHEAVESQDQVLKLLGFAQSVAGSPLEYHPTLPELVRRWIIRSAALQPDIFELGHEDQTTLLQELARLTPEPGNVAAHAAAARKLRRLSESVRAAREFPNQPFVLAQLALSSLEVDPSAAMAAALNALELATGSAEKILLPAFQMLIAQAAARTQNFQQAYRAATHALSDWQDEAAWQFKAAEFARQDEDLSASIQHLEKAAALEPSSIDYRRSLAETYQIAGALNRAAETYLALCADFPAEKDCWLALAELQFQRSQINEAADAAEKALSIDDADEQTVLFTAQIQLYAENYSRAEQLAQQVIEQAPEDPVAAYILARSLSATNHKENALEVLDQALRYSDRPLDLYLERIRLVRTLHGLQPAFQSLQALDRQHPENAAILALMAEYEQAQGHIQDALDTAQRALQLGSQEFNPQEKSRLHALVGRILRRAGQLDQAVHQFVQAVNLNPTRVELYLELGITYQERRQLEEALRVYQNAIQIAPEDPRPYQQAGQALKDSRDYLGAEKMIRRAAELSPHDISIHRLLGSLVALNLVHNS